MTWNRRELLGNLGIATASTLLWTFGCGGPTRPVGAPGRVVHGELRTWLRDAVARLATRSASVHALAVTRTRTTAALDVLGTGLARARRDGVVLTLGEPDGSWREHATADLSQAGILAAVHALVGSAPARAAIELPTPPPSPPELAPIDETALYDRAAAIQRRDRLSSSRIVYASALIDIDDVTVWSIAPGHDRTHAVRRVRARATRAAWSGSRPVVAEAERGWTGELDELALDADAVSAATRAALQLMTPGAFDAGERTVVLAPGVTAALLDAAVRGWFTTATAGLAEVARRVGLDAPLVAPSLTLVDDPTVAGAYGGFAFDDEGEVARAITLLDGGRVAGRLADRAGVRARLAPVAGRARRAGHVGALIPQPSHLRLVPGGDELAQLFAEDGWILEGATGARFDPRSGRVILGAARARELQRGSPTGRVFADVELVGDLQALLASVTGVGSEHATTVVRDDEAGEPRWRSIDAPWLRLRGLVRARRGPP